MFVGTAASGTEFDCHVVDVVRIEYIVRAVYDGLPLAVRDCVDTVGQN